MSCLSNSFDYQVELLGLLPLGFDFSKEENTGVRFETGKLKKVKKPSEFSHDGPVIVSDEELLLSTAIAETKIIRHSNKKDIGNDTDSTNHSKFRVNDDDVDKVKPLADDMLRKLNVDGHQCGDRNIEGNLELTGTANVGDGSSETESESDEPIDKMMKEEHPARFLYKSFSNAGEQQPDFLSYRLPMIFLATQTDPYFFKVSKIRFKPHGCENEMEFIQIHWPILLDDKHRSRGWSGPQFNLWATKDCNEKKVYSQEQSASSSTSKARSSSLGDDAVGDGFDSYADTSCSYHRAYIQAEIKPKSEHGVHCFSSSTRGFKILIGALVGGVWQLEKDTTNYTCKHLAEMRTVKEETLREPRSTRYTTTTPFFYKQVRMLRNYWQCYLAGESHYLVGVNGLRSITDADASIDEGQSRGREIKELRLYDVAAIPGSIKKCGADQGFHPWSKEILENRLYKSLSAIYCKVIDAPVGTESMFVKYNEFDPPIHDADGSLTGPYFLALRQLKIEGLPTPSKPEMFQNLIESAEYADRFLLLERTQFTSEHIPKVEEQESCMILTFANRSIADTFHIIVGGYLQYLRKNDNFPPESGFENLNITKVFMTKPTQPGGNRTQSWRSSNDQQQQSNQSNDYNRQEITAGGNHTQSWRSSNNQQSNVRNINDNSSRTYSADNNSQSWRSSNRQQQSNDRNYNDRRQQYTPPPGDSTQSWRNSGNQQQPNPRDIEDRMRQHYGYYGRHMHMPSSNRDINWRRNNK